MDAPAKEIGKGISDLINVLFTPIQAAVIFRNAWLDDFKEKINRKFNQIPTVRQISPPLNVIGPALDASRYYLEEEQMREMFANLVAHSCDSQMLSAVHPSFVNILTQLSPLDAKILMLFRPKQEMKIGLSISTNENSNPTPELSGTGIYSFPETYLPIVNYLLAKNNTRRMIYSNIVSVPACEEWEAISASIVNLVRLGLIEIKYTQALADDKYTSFYDNQAYKKLAEYIAPGSPGSGFSISTVRGNMLIHGEFDKIVLEKGFVRLTQMGFNFTKVCMIESELISDR
ncbi:DUF4393 domain-containing protein [Caproicibacter fermentans]|uniref:DUF4393 domain-containing protein n=1 Tax=Caproicibacter fermentans TaxID=2576756 RepID=UPI0012ECC02A|nr:DUF4393 domain-containing protein [Caproicibacter fermentans]